MLYKTKTTQCINIQILKSLLKTHRWKISAYQMDKIIHPCTLLTSKFAAFWS